MKQVDVIGGKDLREMFTAATKWLEKSAPEIDALNVFPVPDGDTGTNMLLTMRSCIEEAYRAPDNSVSAVAEFMARGALIGARGNSGVILSQFWRGLAKGMANKDTLDTAGLVAALKEAAVQARTGLTNPVEGTIITVAADIAKAAGECTDGGKDSDVVALLKSVVSAAGASVARTPSLLPVLREAGVVDAGGQGLYTLLEGATSQLAGEMKEIEFKKPHIIISEAPTKLPQALSASDEEPYGYCTEFVVVGKGLDQNDIRKRLEKKGQSLIVVGDEERVRVHIHSLDPGNIIHYATAHLGTLHQVSIRNMDEQHLDFLEMQKERLPVGDIGIVAVVAGDGLADVFTSLGVGAIVPGGQTMNPSTKDILQAVEHVASDSVIILPNNSNIVATAEQVKTLTGKKVSVVPTKSIPQGVAALLAFDYEANFDSNLELMTRATAQVKSIEIVRASRAAKVGGREIKKKQPMGLLDGELVVVADALDSALLEVLSKIEMSRASVLTVYYGEGVELEEAEKTRAAVRDRYPHLEVEVVRGGQPHYSYLVSVE
ncbi:MAG: DAK2 domain-containing protein [Dehalococcoidia bacterium]|jgi:DAK2 domain fusion protein YloV|nr:MAG: DAK2 domain-containing protein [Dehalococcoidia bacterium]